MSKECGTCNYSELGLGVMKCPKWGEDSPCADGDHLERNPRGVMSNIFYGHGSKKPNGNSVYGESRGVQRHSSNFTERVI